MESVFWLSILSLPILPNLWCIWHASRHDFPLPDERKLWIRAGTFAPVIGGILYLAVGMRRARPLRDASLEAGGESGPEPAGENPDRTDR
ncbi:conserved hypothetical protein [uncultured delta proteobacterium]|uniref:Cardiolipin synthase N-terminal domain-containing protein n=1 Tax=uncultured delta proteobacterium TaxID=34034 RepID=A0A212IWC9_9DELT|nr:conserved hypothetical protein [uncultured delta proteobacterium]